MISGSNPLDHGAEPATDFIEYRRHGGVIREQGEQRRFMRDESSEEMGTLAGQPERD
jgi:hypothetical protein